jgi:hypothetical protein
MVRYHGPFFIGNDAFFTLMYRLNRNQFYVQTAYGCMTKLRMVERTDFVWQKDLITNG